MGGRDSSPLLCCKQLELPHWKALLETTTRRDGDDDADAAAGVPSVRIAATRVCAKLRNLLISIDQKSVCLVGQICGGCVLVCVLQTILQGCVLLHPSVSVMDGHICGGSVGFAFLVGGVAIDMPLKLH